MQLGKTSSGDNFSNFSFSKALKKKRKAQGCTPTAPAGRALLADDVRVRAVGSSPSLANCEPPGAAGSRPPARSNNAIVGVIAGAVVGLAQVRGIRCSRP